MIITLSEIADGLLDLIYPPRCLICGELNYPPICDGCRSRIEPVPPPYCSTCGHPMSGELCLHCSERKRSFTTARAAGDYSGVLRQAVHEFKYGGHRMLAAPLADILHTCLTTKSDIPWTTANVIIPVPIHHARKRVRGYNQSELLASELSRLANIPMTAHAVERKRWTRPQVELSAKERKSNTLDAFTVTDPSEIKGKTILLIDDVATTCSTVHECSRVLIKGGASKVYVACLAFGA